MQFGSNTGSMSSKRPKGYVTHGVMQTCMLPAECTDDLAPIEHSPRIDPANSERQSRSLHSSSAPGSSTITVPVRRPKETKGNRGVGSPGTGEDSRHTNPSG